MEIIRALVSAIAVMIPLLLLSSSPSLSFEVRQQYNNLYGVSYDEASAHLKDVISFKSGNEIVAMGGMKWEEDAIPFLLIGIKNREFKRFAENHLKEISETNSVFEFGPYNEKSDKLPNRGLIIISVTDWPNIDKDFISYKSWIGGPLLSMNLSEIQPEIFASRCLGLTTFARDSGRPRVRRAVIFVGSDNPDAFSKEEKVCLLKKLLHTSGLKGAAHLFPSALSMTRPLNHLSRHDKAALNLLYNRIVPSYPSPAMLEKSLDLLNDYYE